MKKIAFVFVMLIMGAIVNVTVGSAHETVYQNATVEAEMESENIETVEFVIYGINGFRVSAEVTINDTQETMNQKMYNFAYEFGYHWGQMTSAGVNMDDEIYYALVIVDGKTATCVRATGNEVMKDLTGDSTINTVTF